MCVVIANNVHDSFKLVTGYYDSDMSSGEIINLQKLAKTGDLEAQLSFSFLLRNGYWY